MSRIPRSVINKIYVRAGDDGFLHGWGPSCEACGRPIGTLVPALHHRLPRSAGGQDTVENLMIVHGDLALNCHNLTEYSIHQNPTRSYRLGHMVRRGDDPARVPVIVARDLKELRA